MPSPSPAAADDAVDLAVLIGRFQPFHNGHAALLARALDCAPQVAVVLGSAFHGRSAKNPFTWQERAAMIRATLDDDARARVRFVPVRDYYDDVRWREAVLREVRAQAALRRAVLVGFHKDASSDYLRHFPDWPLIEIERQDEFDATCVRRIWLEGGHPAATAALLEGLVPAAVAHYLQGWSCLPAFAALREEHHAIEESKRNWGNGPFVTVDAVVRCTGQVLLVRRGRHPGKGRWALPGGFLDGRERLLRGAIRELREETGLSTPDAELVSALVGVAVFDHPDRSQRGRTITHAHCFALDQPSPPPVCGADDAAEARWFALDAVAALEDELFEDHFNILDHFFGLAR